MMTGLEFGIETTAQQVVDAFAKEIRGKNILITGASPGSLGAEVVRVLARDANLVIIAGRNQSKTDQVIQSVLAETPTAHLRPLIIDLASFASVRRAAAEVNAYTEPIHVLINNAAVWMETYDKTEDGIEWTLQTNYLSHFLFTALVFPKILAAKTEISEPRIINVSSSMFVKSGIRFDDLAWKGEGNVEGDVYDNHGAYGQSKTASILFSQELAKRFGAQGILAFSLHPSGTLSNMLPSLPKKDQISLGILLPSGDPNPVFRWKTLAQGASTYIVAAFDPSIKERSGGYLVNCQVTNELLVPHARDPAEAAKLWTLSEELVGIKF